MVDSEIEQEYHNRAAKVLNHRCSLLEDQRNLNWRRVSRT